MIARIDVVKREAALGGVCEVVITGLPIGLGKPRRAGTKLDGRLASAMMLFDPGREGRRRDRDGLRDRAPHRHKRCDGVERAAGQARRLVRRRTSRAGGLKEGA